MHGERKLFASDLLLGYEKENDHRADYVFWSLTNKMAFVGFRFRVAHPFTLGGTIFSGIFKRY